MATNDQPTARIRHISAIEPSRSIDPTLVDDTVALVDSTTTYSGGPISMVNYVPVGVSSTAPKLLIKRKR